MRQAETSGVSLREAATRVFSNASGSYSSNVNLAVENSSWQDEMQLQEMYVSRKSFAFNSDQCAPTFCSTACALRMAHPFWQHMRSWRCLVHAPLCLCSVSAHTASRRVCI